MISRRNFLTILIMMVVIFFLFMFTGAAKIVFSNYKTNEYEPSSMMVADYNPEFINYRQGDVLFLGEDEDVLTYASEWSRYYKRHFYEISAEEPFSGDYSDVSFLVVDGKSLTEEDLDLLWDANRAGCMICFATIPSNDFLREHTDLAQMLGIRSIQRDATTLTGIHLYSGFLLGGEVVYKASDERAMEYQDLQLRVPWFVLESASKVYMSGVLNDAYEEADVTYIPPIVWRYNTGSGYVFAVNSDLMKNLSAIGIYTAMEGSTEEVYAYPIVNSQNLVFVNYPTFAEENSEEIEKLYSRKPMNYLQTLVWPMAAQVSSKNHLTPTFMLSSRLNYNDGAELKNSYYDEFFEIIRECHGEAGLDFVPYKNATSEEKVNADMEFFHSFEDYHYYSAYIGDTDDETAVSLSDSTGEEITTLIRDYNPSDGLITAKDNRIYLAPTTSSQYYSYRKDLTLKSIETALGYSMALQDMSICLYPNTVKEHLQNFAEYYAGCISTLYESFTKFDDTTVTQCGNRIREYLNLDYTTIVSANEKKMTINTNTYGIEKSFIIRLHDKRIKKMSEGDYTKLEDGVYLVTFDSMSVDITLEEKKNSIFDFFE